ncbi:hypothetical protein NQ315_013485, partial [Exocentrus adspersus]
ATLLASPSKAQTETARVPPIILVRRKRTTLALNKVQSKDQKKTSAFCASCVPPDQGQMNALLSTAVVNVKDKDGTIQTCRVLLDSGSESNFVTDSLCQKLGLEKTPINFNVAVKHYRASLYPELRKKTPSTATCVDIKIPNVRLADPTFNIPGSIQILIGVTTFYDFFFIINRRNLARKLHAFTKTLLGWIVSGPVSTNKNILCNFASNETHSIEPESLNINKFWELEEVEMFCEDNFIQTTKRTEK